MTLATTNRSTPSASGTTTRKLQCEPIYLLQTKVFYAIYIYIYIHIYIYTPLFSAILTLTYQCCLEHNIPTSCLGLCEDMDNLKAARRKIETDSLTLEKKLSLGICAPHEETILQCELDNEQNGNFGNKRR